MNGVTAAAEATAACRKAAGEVGDAIADVTVFGDVAAREARAGAIEGEVVVAPALLAPRSVHEWTLVFLRHAKTLIWLLTDGDLLDADGLARFVGAQGALAKPVDPAMLADRLASPFGAARPLRPDPIAADDSALGSSLGAILKGREASQRDLFVQTITEQESGLYTLAYWEHRLDEEFKRSSRFRFPLGLAGFAFDGEVDEDVLLDIAGVILLDTRDVDIVTQFDPRTFVALLPHTGPAGARLFAERVGEELRRRGLLDLLGERLEWRWWTAVCPNSDTPTPREFLAAVLQRLTGMMA
ncbi:MAG: GGDEF domain-containing protein [Planctomycetes bacterium]|nr:GGDEF domain-containing protein [Planctomycetota bacterium]